MLGGKNRIWAVILPFSYQLEWPTILRLLRSPPGPQFGPTAFQGYCLVGQLFMSKNISFSPLQTFVEFYEQRKTCIKISLCSTIYGICINWPNFVLVLVFIHELYISIFCLASTVNVKTVGGRSHIMCNCASYVDLSQVPSALWSWIFLDPSFGLSFWFLVFRVQKSRDFVPDFTNTV